MQRRQTAIVISTLTCILAALNGVAASTAAAPDLPDLAVTYAEDRLVGIAVEEDGIVREQHVTSLTVANLGSAPAARFYVLAEPDPVDARLPDSLPDRHGRIAPIYIEQLAAGGSLDLTVEWSMVPTALAIEVDAQTDLVDLSSTETTLENNDRVVPAEQSTPVTIGPAFSR